MMPQLQRDEKIVIGPGDRMLRHCCRLTQHSLPGGPLRPYPGGILHRLIAPALAGTFLLDHLVGAGEQAGEKVQLTIRSGSAKEEMRRERAQPLD
jgi:hypothetical protein